MEKKPKTESRAMAKTQEAIADKSTIGTAPTTESGSFPASNAPHAIMPEPFPHISAQELTKDPQENPAGMQLKTEVALCQSLHELHSRLVAESANEMPASQGIAHGTTEHEPNADYERRRLICHFLTRCHATQRSKAWNYYLHQYGDKIQRILRRSLNKRRDWPLVREHEDDLRQNALVGAFVALTKASNVLAIRVIDAWLLVTIQRIISKNIFQLSKTGKVERLQFSQESDNDGSPSETGTSHPQDILTGHSEDELIAKLDERRHRDILKHAINQLSPESKRLTELYMQGLTQQAIGAQLGVSAPTVNRDLKSLFERLRRHFKD